MKIRDAVEQFLNNRISSGNFSPETVAKYRRELTRLADFLESAGAYTLNDIRAAAIMQFLIRRAKEVANSTFVRNISIFKSVFGFFYEGGEMREDLCPFLTALLHLFYPQFAQLPFPDKLERLGLLLEKKDHFERQFFLKDEVEEIKKSLTRVGREQFKSLTILEGQQAAMESAITRLNEELAKKDQQVLELKQSLGESERDQRIKILQSLFPVLDGLEEGLQMFPQFTSPGSHAKKSWLRRIFHRNPGGDSADSSQLLADWMEGLRLIHRRMLNLLEREGILPMVALGEPFDPHFHVAVGAEYRPDMAENTIVAEQLKGYQIRNRPLRLAEVVVAKSSP
jgi:molecular chaperone GrpE (heat shock protein)